MYEMIFSRCTAQVKTDMSISNDFWEYIRVCWYSVINKAMPDMDVRQGPFKTGCRVRRRSRITKNTLPEYLQTLIYGQWK